MNDDGIIDWYIAKVEDEKTSIAKREQYRKRHLDKTSVKQSILEKGKGIEQTVATAALQMFQQINKGSTKRLRFAIQPSVQRFDVGEEPVMITYESGADGNYVSEKDRARLGMPILRQSKRRVGVANGGAIKGKFVTRLSFPQLSKKAAEADTFDEFKTSLMSVGKTSDDGNVSVFTKEAVKIYKEEDVLITCKGEPILIVKRDERGRYHIPLVQQRRQWQPKTPTKAAKNYSF